MGKGKKKTVNGSSAKTSGVDGKDAALPHTDAQAPAAPTSRNGTAPSTPDELSPAIAHSRQNGQMLKAEPTGSNKAEAPTNGKAAPLKNGKGHSKVAPLPPGFLESELQTHKRKLKAAEHTVDIHRQEIAALKRQLAAVSAKTRELRDVKAALESACKAAHEQKEEAERGATLYPGSYRWLLMGASVLSVSAVAAAAMMRSATLRSQ